MEKKLLQYDIEDALRSEIIPSEASKKAWSKFNKIKNRMNLLAKINVISNAIKKYGTTLFMPKNYGQKDL